MFTPQINNSSGYFDSLNWTLVSGTYIASGGENWIVIGNFKDDATTSTSVYNSLGAPSCYVYIDNVSLTPCTGIN